MNDKVCRAGASVLAVICSLACMGAGIVLIGALVVGIVALGDMSWVATAFRVVAGVFCVSILVFIFGSVISSGQDEFKPKLYSHCKKFWE